MATRRDANDAKGRGARWRSPRSWLPRSWRRQRTDEDFGAEILAHIELEADRLIAGGMPADEARAAARRTFGNVTHARERYYESRRVMWMDDLRTDVRQARRTLFRHPGFAFVAILTLAFGIGANTAIFSVVNAVLLRPLPFKDADRLVRISEVAPTRLMAPLVASDLAALQAQTRTLSHIGVHQPMMVTMSGSDGPIRAIGVRLSPSLLSMLGARTEVGRLLDARDERAGAEPAAIVSHALWQHHFAGAADIIGQPVVLDGSTYAIAGVMTRDFAFPDRNAQFWLPYVPATTGPAMRQRWPLTARLKDGVSLAAASAEINALIPRLHGDAMGAASAPRAASTRGSAPAPAPAPAPTASVPPATVPPVSARTSTSNAASVATSATASAPADTRTSAPAAPRFVLIPLLELQVAPIRPVLYILAAAVGIVLLIACVNVANLLLARTRGASA